MRNRIHSACARAATAVSCLARALASWLKAGTETNENGPVLVFEVMLVRSWMPSNPEEPPKRRHFLSSDLEVRWGVRHDLAA